MKNTWNLFVKIMAEKISLSVIRQKGRFQKGCFKKTKHARFSEKHFLPPDMHTYMCVSEGKKC